MRKFRRSMLVAVLLFAPSHNVWSQTVATEATNPQPIRYVRANLTNEPADGQRSRLWHIVFGPDPADLWLGKHTYGGSRGFEDRNFCCGTWYDANHDRFFTRTLNLFEKDDPADVRIARFESKTSENPHGLLRYWQLLGYYGGADVNEEGVMHHGMAVVPFKAGEPGDGKIGLMIMVAPGEPNRPRYSNEISNGQDLVPAVAIFPDGTIVLNFGTDPATRPRVIVQGDLLVGGEIFKFNGDAMPHIFRNQQQATEAIIGLQKQERIENARLRMIH